MHFLGNLSIHSKMSKVAEKGFENNSNIKDNDLPFSKGIEIKLTMHWYSILWKAEGWEKFFASLLYYLLQKSLLGLMKHIVT